MRSIIESVIPKKTNKKKSIAESNHILEKIISLYIMSENTIIFESEIKVKNPKQIILREISKN